MSTVPLSGEQIHSCGHPIPLDDQHFGWLTDSSELVDDAQALRRRLVEDGYLYLRNVLDPDLVLDARRELLTRLRDAGQLAPGAELMDGILPEDSTTRFRPDLAENNAAIDSVVFGQDIFRFYDRFFGEKSRAFSFKWLRAVGHGKGTNPHCDWVYMSRGTPRLMTAWIPYGEVSLELGGLMVLEKSHQKSERIANYLKHDVDDYCENRPEQVAKVKEKGGWSHPGHLSTNPATLQEHLGGRWLTAEYRPGDMLTFCMTLVHASVDNQTNRIRLSTDTRYQPASEPADDRWIGENPVGHSTAGKRGRIC